MKLFFTLLSVMLTCSLSINAQIKKAAENSKSNIESLSEQTGSFSKKEIIDIGKSKGINVKVVRITDILTGKTTVGIKLSGYSGGSYSSEKVAFLDSDEIDSFLKVINYVISNVFTSDIPSNSIEYNYYSRGGFSGGAYNSEKKWAGYLKLEKYDSNSYFFLDQESFKSLGELMLVAKSRL